MIQIGEIIKDVPFFRSLGRESIDYITEKLKFKQFSKGDMICKVGDPGDKMYIVLSGKVEVKTAGGQSLAFIHGGNYFGEMSLLTGEPRSASVEAAEDTETFLLEKPDFDVILDKYPTISIAMSKIMSQRLRDTNAAVANKATSSTPAGPKGSLKDRHITDVIAFCDSNSLTGELVVTKGSEKAVFSFDKGEISDITLGALEMDQALDAVMTWEDGDFIVKPKILSFEESTEQTEQAEKQLTVLVINHSMVVRKLLEKALVELGHTVQSVGDVSAGIASMKKQAPDLIISDFKYPEINGAEFCAQVRENSDFESIPFIFLTDSTTPADLRKKLEATPNTEVCQAIDAKQVIETVKKIV